MALIELAADPLWRRPCLAYHVQARPDEALAGLIAAEQARLAAAFPIALHLIPAHALHCSVMTLIQPHGEAAGKEADWRRVRAAMGEDEDVARLVRAAGPVPVTLDRLRVARRAIIAWTPEQPPVFLELRARLAALLGRLGLPAPQYALTHVTIARYRQGGRVEGDAVAGIEASARPLGGTFPQLRLVRERIYPSLRLDPL